jgi:NitT/TauT family transport system ATP-binding protein
MKQRVNIARALASGAKILLMDEPFGALDEQTRFSLGQELVKIWGETRRTILFVTHSIPEAVVLGDYVVVMTARPASVREVVRVGLPRPRNPEDPSVVEIRRYLWEVIREESVRQMGVRV